ncbi:MAG TPA: phosphatidate cytidylyltransferase [Casimicrobiaceae bacterium]|nr:phosphatidate cytidylyltransferase [Casimicrobiaceae bacterium]
MASNLALRIGTGVVLVAAILAALFLLPAAGFAVVMLVIVSIAAHEWARLIELRDGAVIAFTVLVFVAGAALLALALASGFAPVVAAACGIATFYWLAAGIPSVLANWQPSSPVARALAAFVVLEGALVAIVALQARSAAFALAAMAIVWIADTAAYFTGRRLGRHKLAPRISPGKTWEGATGAVVAVVAYALLLVPLARRAGFAAEIDATAIVLWILLAIALVALSIVGDLHESLLKRRAGVKDSGTLLPGHGGVLDRIDALLAAMPPVALASLVFVGSE